jgi:hypothetical protein
MFEEIKPTDIEGYSNREKNLYKLVEKMRCEDCFLNLLEAVDILTFDPEDFVVGRRYAELRLRG